MQSKTTRGVRNLLVSTGVISLVLSVAAPAALADVHNAKGDPKPGHEHADNAGTGAERIQICHNGRVIEVDDDAVLGGHSKHGDAPITQAADPGPARAACVPPASGGPIEGDELAELCLAGELEEVFESERTDAHVDPGMSEGGELTCTAQPIVGGGKVEVCHQGAVIEIAAEALEEHLDHGDAQMVEGTTCPAVIIEHEDEEIDVDPVVLVDEPVVAEVPVKTPPAAPPAQPVPPADTPRPVIIISTDTVTKPVTPATPAAPVTPAMPQGENEVLGAVTTRHPTPGLGALDPGAQTAGSITALAATGSGSTTVLVVVGLVLLLAGFGLQVGARRRVRSSDLAA